MHVDGATLREADTVRRPVVIVGAGPTGLAAARELSSAGVECVLLESGSLVAAESSSVREVNDLDRGAVSAGGYYPLHQIRRRQVGGTATMWDANVPSRGRGARYVPLDDVDFEQRPGVEASGWPWTRAQFDPLYARAQKWCGLGPYRYAASDWPTSGSTPEAAGDLGQARDLVVPGVFQLGHGHVFFEQHRDAVVADPRITLYSDMTVVELEQEEAGPVSAVLARSRSGIELRFEATFVVLAAGGLENARLLLLSSGRRETGIGNQHDVVGRYFMDHPLVQGGTLTLRPGVSAQKFAFYDWREVEGTHVCGHLKLSSQALRAEDTVNVGAMLLARLPDRLPSALHSLQQMVKGARAGTMPNAKDLRALAGLGGDLPRWWRDRQLRRGGANLPLNTGGWSRSGDAVGRFSHFQVIWATEQLPDRENRIQLGDDCDRLGRRRARVSWRWTDADQRAIVRVQDLFSRAFESSPLARFVAHRVDGQPVFRAPTMHHPMGGTRMNDNPRQGVVDAHCQVHGVPNLFIVGGSVFPTGGFANPTLTMVATSLLCCDRIVSVLRSSGSRGGEP